MLSEARAVFAMVFVRLEKYYFLRLLEGSRDGGWSSWHPISWEDTPCCNGLLTRRRNCDDPCPAGNGAKCEGDSEDKKDCNECKRELDGCQHECLNYNHIKESPLTFKCYCDEGYRVSPADSKKCEKKECKRLSAPANGSITPSICESNPRHEDACFRTCDRGYEPIGPEYVECTDGKWSDTNVFQCRVRKCQALSELDNGKITPAICNEQPLHGRTCVYECDPGYKVKGHNSNICDDGHWRFSFSTCEDVEDPSFGKTCPSEPESYIAEEGRITATLDLELIKPTATDNSGVVRLSSFPQVTSPHAFPEGITTLIYEAEDPSGNKARCFFKVSVQVLRCSVLPAPANGKFENGTCGNVYGSSCRFACNKGYKITGSVERKCVKKIGTDEVYWKGNETSCAIVRCFSLNTPANTMKAGLGCNDSRPRYNTNCFFRCNRGFEAEKGSERVTCKETGQWDGDPLQCKGES
ncbi:Sushi repeat-containing protein SRPX [Stylophora pistillata]|uniref:Sushi repeat-containing protein SRPX n=1 Tax=Stylophora pistillata TaxID=50429 RepID=A0A2B4S3K1_STYPI|nr:Sushi repeat-containing protein SRPX [Stylophora pistillata]